MKRIEYSPNPPPQTLTEQSSKDLALYLQNELTQISSFIGELSDTPDTPSTIGYGSVASGLETTTSNNVVSIAANGTFGNFAKFTITLASPINSTSVLQTQVEGLSGGLSIISASSSYISTTTFGILVIKTDGTATTTASCAFNFICYERDA